MITRDGLMYCTKSWFWFEMFPRSKISAFKTDFEVPSKGQKLLLKDEVIFMRIA